MYNAYLHQVSNSQFIHSGKLPQSSMDRRMTPRRQTETQNSLVMKNR